MAYPYTSLLGDATVRITSSASAAVNGTVARLVGISLGESVVNQIPDIALQFGIPRTAQLGTVGRPAYKITFNGSDLNNALTFAQQGVKPGSALVLASV